MRMSFVLETNFPSTSVVNASEVRTSCILNQPRLPVCFLLLLMPFCDVN